MNFFNVFFKTHLLEKPLSQILQSYESSFSWTEPTWLLGSHFCVKFDNKLNTWMFKLSLCGGLIHFFWEQLLLQFGLLHFFVIVQKKTSLSEKLLSQIQQMCVLIHFFEDNSYCYLSFYSFVQWFWIVWLFNPMNFFNMFLKHIY